ncbi:MAG: hypothetical protein Q8Q06_01845 [bacterium]|nr:hypothetical protein [bacterium]
MIYKMATSLMFGLVLVASILGAVPANKVGSSPASFVPENYGIYLAEGAEGVEARRAEDKKLLVISPAKVWEVGKGIIPFFGRGRASLVVWPADPEARLNATIRPVYFVSRILYAMGSKKSGPIGCQVGDYAVHLGGETQPLKSRPYKHKEGADEFLLDNIRPEQLYIATLGRQSVLFGVQMTSIPQNELWLSGETVVYEYGALERNFQRKDVCK